MKKKRNKPEDYDDGRTIANMNVEGMPWYEPEEVRKNRESLKAEKPTRKEKRAMIRGAFAATLPFLFAILISVSIAFLVVWLWLN